MLDNINKDILTEIMNISIGEAASLLSQIVDKKINLSIPDIKMFTPPFSFKNVIDVIPCLNNCTIVSSSINFGDEFKGKAQLCFPKSKVKNLIMLCTDDHEYTHLSSEDDDFLDNDFDIIMEIGNIILNSILGGIGNFLNMKLNYSLPSIEFINICNFENNIKLESEYYYIVLYVSFNIDETEIEGAIISMFTLSSLRVLIDKLDEMKVIMSE